MNNIIKMNKKLSATDISGILKFSNASKGKRDQ